MSAAKEELFQAIDLALAGQWDAAHEIVQEHDDAFSAWIHAVLHKMEGDPGNSGYWYRRAGRKENVGAEPRAELEAIRKEVEGLKG